MLPLWLSVPEPLYWIAPQEKEKGEPVPVLPLPVELPPEKGML